MILEAPSIERVRIMNDQTGDLINEYVNTKVPTLSNANLRFSPALLKFESGLVIGQGLGIIGPEPGVRVLPVRMLIQPLNKQR